MALAAANPSATGPDARMVAFEAASTKRRTTGWHAATSSPNAGVLDSLRTLRDRSRMATRNNGFAKGALDKLVANIVGTGIKPRSKADDKSFARAVQALWLRWTDESDADGLLDWYGQEAQAVRTWLDAGECFIRLRDRLPVDGLVVPFQVQVLEPELCPHDYNITTSSGNRVRAGVEFSPIGRRVAYYFHPQRPGDLQDYDPSELRRVPAEQVLHLYKPVRPGQIRGIPALTQALIRLREVDAFDDATLIRQKLSALFVAFLTSNPADPTANLNPLLGTESATASAEDGRQTLALRPGMFQTLAPGEKVEWSDPPDVSGYADFMRQQLRSVSSAVGVPYEVLTGDMTAVNDRVIRVVLHEFQRSIQAEQHQTVAFQLCRPVWRAWMDRVFLSGTLPIPPDYLMDSEPWTRVEWAPQSWPYLHPVQDVEAQALGIRNGFTSRSAVVSAMGEDAEEVDAQQEADNERADAARLKYDSDGRQSKASGTPPPPQQRPTQGAPAAPPAGDEPAGDPPNEGDDE